MIVEFQILVIALLSICQNDRRKTAATIYAANLLLHDLFMSGLDGGQYYLSAGMFDFITIAVLSVLYTPSRLRVELLKISFASLCLNAMGWAMWMLYAPPDPYNWAFTSLYICAIVALIKEERRHYGGYKLGRRGGYFRVDDRSGIFSYKKLQIKGRV